MTNCGERHIIDWVYRYLGNMDSMPIKIGNENAEFKLIPSQINGRHLFIIVDLYDNEIFRFTVEANVQKVVSSAETAGWISGKWGSAKNLPAAGDIVLSPVDNSEWRVIEGITPTNPYKVELENIVTGEKYFFVPSWKDEVTFKKVNNDAVIQLITESFAASGIAEQQIIAAKWIIGGKK